MRHMAVRLEVFGRTVEITRYRPISEAVLKQNARMFCVTVDGGAFKIFRLTSRDGEPTFEDAWRVVEHVTGRLWSRDCTNSEVEDWRRILERVTS